MSGVHLPAFAAAEGGLFAAQGIEVQFVECVPARDRSLRGFGTTLKALAGNDADFALSSVAYLLAANAEAREPIGARFAAVFHQRNPIAAIVAMDSGLREPGDLPAGKTAGSPGSWYLQEYAGALAHMGLGPAAIVDASHDLHAALRDGEIDVIPAWVDTTPVFGKDGSIRSIPLDVEVYATGLVAADRLPLELVVRTRDALVAGYELQREQPELGIAAFRGRYSWISEEYLRTGWSVLEPYAFDGPPLGSMDAQRWQATIDYTVATHSLSVFPPEQVYRPELLASALEYSPA